MADDLTVNRDADEVGEATTLARHVRTESCAPCASLGATHAHA